MFSSLVHRHLGGGKGTTCRLMSSHTRKGAVQWPCQKMVRERQEGCEGKQVREEVMCDEGGGVMG